MKHKVIKHKDITEWCKCPEWKLSCFGLTHRLHMNYCPFCGTQLKKILEPTSTSPTDKHNEKTQ